MKRDKENEPDAAKDAKRTNTGDGMIEDGENLPQKPVAGPLLDDESALSQTFEPTHVVSDGDGAQDAGSGGTHWKRKVRVRNLTFCFVLFRGRFPQLSTTFFLFLLFPERWRRGIGPNAFS